MPITLSSVTSARLSVRDSGACAWRAARSGVSSPRDVPSEGNVDRQADDHADAAAANPQCQP